MTSLKDGIDMATVCVTLVDIGKPLTLLVSIWESTRKSS